ncbi:glycosyltransferase family 2 protein [Pedobacter aquae]|uniref:Glycosyltransferase family 2 protein n=1 Tax=Pedobacter aquae TaxID=2605747 RepID=A0A5C0VDY6_9SPHI|nr:glycosyltransferase family 2 protein [Pedobacter aquae]QEK50327.1 glycosyltransferase family 2 protein [Pedobacter aquae]
MQKTNTPLVSIIIPVYNSAPFLAKTIECAISQDWSNKEIIIVDDGSTDNSYLIAKQYENDIVKVFHQSNKGGSSARNCGLQKSGGDYIQFLDADDLMPTDKISKQMKYLAPNPNSVVSCKWVRFKNNITETIGVIGPHNCLKKNLNPIDWLICRHTILLHCWLTPRVLIKKAGLWNEKITYNDDGEYFYRVVAEASSVLYCDETIVYYRTENKESVSSMKSEKRFKSEYLSALTYKNTLNKLTDAEIAKTAIGNFLKYLVFQMYPLYPSLIKKCKSHGEYKYANIKPYNAGLSKIISSIFGWKLTKRIKNLF